MNDVVNPVRDEDLQRLRGVIRAFVLRRVRNETLAEDITQETLVRLSRKLHTLRAADRLEAWVFQIARNAVADHFRTQRESEPFEEGKHGESAASPGAGTLAAEEMLLREQLAAYVRSVVERLPEHYREALWLTEFEGISQVDLARRLGLSVSAAKSRVQRARAMARAEMERCCHWETDRYGTVVDVQPKPKAGCNQCS